MSFRITPNSKGGLTRSVRKNKTKLMRESMMKQQEYDKNLRHLSSMASGANQYADLNWDKVLESITSTSKKLDTYEIIIEYFMTLKEFVDYIKDTYKSNYLQILSTMAIHTEYFFLKANSVLMKVGDKGDRFYIILKGKLAILVIRSEKLHITEEDYFKYLYNLKVFSEDELFMKAINSSQNQLAFPIKDQKSDMFNIANLPFTKKSNKSIDSVYRKSVSISKFSSYDLYNISKYSVMPKVSSIEDYISILKPMITEGDQRAKLVEVFYYFKVETLEQGKKLGEAALENDSCRRNATIMAEEDTHLAFIGRDAYKQYFQDESEKVKKMCVNTLHSTILFKSFPKRYFEKKYFFMFIQEKISNGRVILEQNSTPSTLIVSIEGDFEISMKSSFKRLLATIEYYGGSNSDCELLTYIKKNYFVKYSHFLESESNYKIFIVKNKEIFGLPSFFNVDSEKCFYKVECISRRGIIFKMDYKVYNSSVRLVTQVKDGEKIKIKEQIHLFLERLMQIRDVSIGGFLRRYGSEQEKKKFQRILYFNAPTVRIITNEPIKVLSKNEIGIENSGSSGDEEEREGEVNNNKSNEMMLKSTQLNYINKTGLNTVISNNFNNNFNNNNNNNFLAETKSKLNGNLITENNNNNLKTNGFFNNTYINNNTNNSNCNNITGKINTENSGNNAPNKVPIINHSNQNNISNSNSNKIVNFDLTHLKQISNIDSSSPNRNDEDTSRAIALANKRRSKSIYIGTTLKTKLNNLKENMQLEGYKHSNINKTVIRRKGGENKKQTLIVHSQSIFSQKSNNSINKGKEHEEPVEANYNQRDFYHTVSFFNKHYSSHSSSDDDCAWGNNQQNIYDLDINMLSNTQNNNNNSKKLIVHHNKSKTAFKENDVLKGCSNYSIEKINFGWIKNNYKQRSSIISCFRKVKINQETLIQRKNSISTVDQNNPSGIRSLEKGLTLLFPYVKNLIERSDAFHSSVNKQKQSQFLLSSSSNNPLRNKEYMRKASKYKSTSYSGNEQVINNHISNNTEVSMENENAMENLSKSTSINNNNKSSKNINNEFILHQKGNTLLAPINQNMKKLSFKAKNISVNISTIVNQHNDARNQGNLSSNKLLLINNNHLSEIKEDINDFKKSVNLPLPNYNNNHNNNNSNNSYFDAVSPKSKTGKLQTRMQVSSKKLNVIDEKKEDHINKENENDDEERMKKSNSKQKRKTKQNKDKNIYTHSKQKVLKNHLDILIDKLKNSSYESMLTSPTKNLRINFCHQLLEKSKINGNLNSNNNNNIAAAGIPVQSFKNNEKILNIDDSCNNNCHYLTTKKQDNFFSDTKHYKNHKYAISAISSASSNITNFNSQELASSIVHPSKNIQTQLGNSGLVNTQSKFAQLNIINSLALDDYMRNNQIRHLVNSLNEKKDFKSTNLVVSSNNRYQNYLNNNTNDSTLSKDIRFNQSSTTTTILHRKEHSKASAYLDQLKSGYNYLDGANDEIIKDYLLLSSQSAEKNSFFNNKAKLLSSNNSSHVNEKNGLVQSRAKYLFDKLDFKRVKFSGKKTESYFNLNIPFLESIFTSANNTEGFLNSNASYCTNIINNTNSSKFNNNNRVSILSLDETDKSIIKEKGKFPNNDYSKNNKTTCNINTSNNFTINNNRTFNNNSVVSDSPPYVNKQLFTREKFARQGVDNNEMALNQDYSMKRIEINNKTLNTSKMMNMLKDDSKSNIKVSFINKNDSNEDSMINNITAKKDVFKGK